MPTVKKMLYVAALAGLSLGFACSEATTAFGQDAAASVAAAKKAAMEALSSPSEWKGPTTGPKPIAGKRVAIIPCGLITEGCNRPARAATEAAKTAGWVLTVLDGQADTGKQLAAINAAVDGKYDAIVMILIDPIQVNEGVQRAIAANIPVVTLGQPLYTDARKALSQIPDISHDWLKTGELIGDYMIAKSDGKVDALCSTIRKPRSFSTVSSQAPKATQRSEDVPRLQSDRRGFHDCADQLTAGAARGGRCPA